MSINLVKPQEKVKKAALTRKKNTINRNKMIVKEFKNLYEVQRLRFDDTIKALAGMFSVSTSTIRRILKKPF